MGILGKFFQGKKEDAEKSNPIDWIALRNLDEVDTLFIQSKAKTQIVFKHSTSCGISRMVLNMFTSNFSLSPGQADVYFIDLHAHRKVSNYVADHSGVVHQSPQLLVIRNGEVVFHTSHGAIAEVQLEQFV